jgi:pyruvate/2-oxoglutarate dehydrogenase complex dihydrolipoamide dehydrogenase (E3) component
MSEHFDLVVLGAGSAGIAMAIRAARHGAKVAVVEAGALGGTCVNVGCVPKKAMWLAAELAEAQRVAHEVGFDMQPGALRWPDFVARRSAYIDNIHASYRKRFDELKIELVDGYGRFAAPRRIAVGARELDAEHVLVATGAHSRRETVPAANSASIPMASSNCAPVRVASRSSAAATSRSNSPACCARSAQASRWSHAAIVCCAASITKSATRSPRRCASAASSCCSRGRS